MNKKIDFSYQEHRTDFELFYGQLYYDYRRECDLDQESFLTQKKWLLKNYKFIVQQYEKSRRNK